MFKFANEESLADEINEAPWKVLIVDDNEYVHEITKSVLKDFKFDNKTLDIKSAYNSKDAFDILYNDSDYALVLLDVVMERQDAGLVLAKQIRDVLHNSLTRIVLRTGEPNSAPQRTVIEEYDIHDYKEKTELDDLKLFTTLISALRSYRDLQKIKNNEIYLQKVVDERTTDLRILNEELEERVQRQSSLIIEQSKFVQFGETISMIAHQWRQPLASASAIIGKNLTMYELEALTLSDVNKDLYKLEDILTHLSLTIDEFRDFFKPSKQKVSFDILNLMDSSIQLIEDSLISKNITIKKDYNKCSQLFGFENEIKQVFLNIINNAKDSILNVENPTIYIKIDEIDNFVQIFIEDNGGGVKPEIINKLFEPYFSTKSKNGTGLGLYMCKIIIEEHSNGSINIENIEQGARVSILFPLP